MTIMGLGKGNFFTKVTKPLSLVTKPHVTFHYENLRLFKTPVFGPFRLDHPFDTPTFLTHRLAWCFQLLLCLCT